MKVYVGVCWLSQDGQGPKNGVVEEGTERLKKRGDEVGEVWGGGVRGQRASSVG